MAKNKNKKKVDTGAGATRSTMFAELGAEAIRARRGRPAVFTDRKKKASKNACRGRVSL